jgi:hypothetical protein
LSEKRVLVLNIILKVVNNWVKRLLVSVLFIVVEEILDMIYF